MRANGVRHGAGRQHGGERRDGRGELDSIKNVKRLVRAASKLAAAERTELQRQLSSGQRQVSIDANPWLVLFREVQQALPLLDGASSGELARVFVAIINITKLVAPSFIEQVRADAAAGGFDKIRERIVRLLRESSRSEES